MHSTLSKNDPYYIDALITDMTHLSLPTYGSKDSYTKGAAQFVGSGSTTKSKRYVVTAVNNDGGGVASHFYQNAEANHKKDCEAILLTAIEYNIKKKSKGTLYMALSKGPCRSCKKLISHIFRSYYTEIRVVVWYGGNKTEKGFDGMQYGYEKAGSYSSGGSVAVYDEKG